MLPPPYLGWVLLYALANTGFDLHTWGGQLGNPPWLLRELLTGQGAPHLYFIPILFQCYLLYPLLRRWVNRAPVQSAAWALMVTFLLQGGYLLHDLELLPFSLPAHLWMLFPTWSFYFVAGMCLQRLDRSHLRVQCKKAALPLLLISAVFACLYCALSHRLSILHAIRPALLAATLLAFFCGIGVWEWLRACPGAGRVVSFFSRHAMGIYYNHVLVIYYLRQFPGSIWACPGCCCCSQPPYAFPQGSRSSSASFGMGFGTSRQTCVRMTETPVSHESRQISPRSATTP